MQVVIGLPEMHSLIGMYGPVMMVEGVTGGEISVMPEVDCDRSSPSSADEKYRMNTQY